MTKLLNLELIQSQMDTVNWYDFDDKRLHAEVQQLDDGIGIEFTYADDGAFYEFEVLGSTLEEAYQNACTRTADRNDEPLATNIDALANNNDLLCTAIRAMLDDRGVSELTLGNLYIYADTVAIAAQNAEFIASAPSRIMQLEKENAELKAKIEQLEKSNRKLKHRVNFEEGYSEFLENKYSGDESWY